ncbi:MAG: hypothetical protein ACP5OG_02870 [Candidatus Nanoarchaeia archaeon]
MAGEIINTETNFSLLFYVFIISVVLIIGLAIFLIKKGRGNFKPNKWKIIASIAALVLWIFIMNYFNASAMCKICICTLQICLDYAHFMLIKPACHCCCSSFFEMLISNLKNIFIPFAVVYIIFSLFEKRKNK